MASVDLQVELPSGQVEGGAALSHGLVALRHRLVALRHGLVAVEHDLLVLVQDVLDDEAAAGEPVQADLPADRVEEGAAVLTEDRFGKHADLQGRDQHLQLLFFGMVHNFQ